MKCLLVWTNGAIIGGKMGVVFVNSNGSDKIGNNFIYGSKWPTYPIISVRE